MNFVDKRLDKATAPRLLWVIRVAAAAKPGLPNVRCAPKSTLDRHIQDAAMCHCTKSLRDSQLRRTARL